MRDIKRTKKVDQYILDNLEDADTGATGADALPAFYQEFVRVSNYPANLVRFPKEVERMADYLKGLPSGLSIAFTYHDIDQLGGEWGYTSAKSTPAAFEKFESDYWQIIACRLLILARQQMRKAA